MYVVLDPTLNNDMQGSFYELIMCIDGSKHYVEMFIIVVKLENYITHIIRKIHFILRQAGNNISPPANDFQK